MVVTAPLHDNLDVVGCGGEVGQGVRHPFPTPKSVLDALKSMDSHMGLCLDVAHATRGSEFGAGDRQRRSAIVRRPFQGSKDTSVKATYCNVGEGIVPTVGIFQELWKIGYRGAVNLESQSHAGNASFPGIYAGRGGGLNG